MHTIKADGWRIHVNGDLSGDAMLVQDGEGEVATFPGALLRAVVARVQPVLVEALQETVQRIDDEVQHGFRCSRDYRCSRCQLLSNARHALQQVTP